MPEKPDPGQTGPDLPGGTALQFADCAAPDSGESQLSVAISEAFTVDASVFVGTLTPTSEVRTGADGMIYTAVTVSVQQHLAGIPTRKTISAFVPGGVLDGVTGLTTTHGGVGTGPDGRFLGILNRDPGGLGGGRLLGLPIAAHQLVYADTTCFVPSDLAGTTTKHVTYTLIDQGKAHTVTATVPTVSLDTALRAFG